MPVELAVERIRILDHLRIKQQRSGNLLVHWIHHVLLRDIVVNRNEVWANLRNSLPGFELVLPGYKYRGRRQRFDGLLDVCRSTSSNGVRRRRWKGHPLVAVGKPAVGHA